jgi:AcrR family transcriptional regulator
MPSTVALGKGCVHNWPRGKAQTPNRGKLRGTGTVKKPGKKKSIDQADDPGPPPAQAKKKATRNPQRTSAAILAAAVKEFTERGFGGARIDQIAARARINKRMLYHYYGGKEALYIAVLESAYVGIRSAEAELDLENRDPAEAMRHLARFTWDYFVEHPEFLSLLNTENLLRGKYIKTSSRIIALHSPMTSLLADTLRRGVEIGEFRDNVDPVDLYVSIAALGFFYLSNRWTLSTIFRRDLAAPRALAHWGDHVVEVIMSYLRPDA